MTMIAISTITTFIQELLCLQGTATALVSSHSPNNIHAMADQRLCHVSV